jgi:predicted nucleotidyltransferase
LDRTELIDVIADWAREELKIRAAILFGSFARDEPNPNDIDVAVRLDGEPGDARESTGSRGVPLGGPEEEVNAATRLDTQ